MPREAADSGLALGYGMEASFVPDVLVPGRIQGADGQVNLWWSAEAVGEGDSSDSFPSVVFVWVV